MAIIGLQHVSFTVSDLDRSIEFYSDILGLDYLGTQWMDSDSIYDVFGLQGVKARYGWFKTGRYGILELFEFDPADDCPVEIRPNQVGPHHFALEVRSIDELYAYLTKQGAKGIRAPKSLQGASKVALIADPDGIIIELIDLGMYLTPKIKVFGKVFGFVERFKRRRAGAVVTTGAFQNGSDK